MVLVGVSPDSNCADHASDQQREVDGRKQHDLHHLHDSSSLIDEGRHGGRSARLGPVPRSSLIPGGKESSQPGNK
jgi:hypothetical protein